ncbi:hypothetical protein BGZ93_005040 [Podila epicladia]|nr:hypothetical protein BGZ92_009732 [Podila epicladia]KAG0099955.1 hypothetical protein BGZ93_005040 [Podila epicladia]
MRMHIKFHNDVVSVKDSAQDAAALLNGLLSTLEPVLADHGKDFSRAVNKLSRNIKSGHTFSEWDAALRQPFEHLSVYNEWLQRIDPHSKFNKDSLAQLSALVNRVQVVVEANQHPRGMLKRISTFARGVIRRPSSAQLLIEKNNATSATSPKSPSPSTPISITTTEYAYTTTPTDTARQELPATKGHGTAAEKVRDIADTKSVQKAGSTEPQEQIASTDDESSAIYTAVPFSRQHRGSNSDMASIGSMTLAPSTESLSTKDITAAVIDAKTSIRQRSAASQKFLDEREARKATLRLGAQAFIQSKAESLQAQSPTFVSRPSIDRLRTITRREAETKPPVKSLISFWEQTTEPIEI